MSARELAEPSVERILRDEPEDLLALARDWCERGMSDGFPIIPPTEARVADMVRGAGRPAEDLVGELLPLGGQATIEMIAIQAVMAGCSPEYMPVVCAAVAAISTEPFDLRGLQSTTHPAGLCVIVNGPVRQTIGLNGGTGCLGPGTHSNATIGRAVRLCMINIGGAFPGVRDMATQGHPGKYSYCFAENEEENPWEPFHVERGFAPDDSTVTVVAGSAPQNIYDSIADSPEHILDIAASSLTSLGCNNIWGLQRSEVHLVLGPEHAKTIADAGWSKRDVRLYLFEHARLPLHVVKRGGAWGAHVWPSWIDTTDDATLIPIVGDPDRVFIWVAGGIGKQSLWIPTMSLAVSVTARVEMPYHQP